MTIKQNLTWELPIMMMINILLLKIQELTSDNFTAGIAKENLASKIRLSRKKVEIISTK